MAGARYIVYLVPEGELYELLEAYYEESLMLCRNDAHDYLPHCTLTGFFSIPDSSDGQLLASLVSTLEKAIKDAVEGTPHQSESSPIAWVSRLYDESAIGLAVQAPRLVRAVSDWAQRFPYPADMEPIRPKQRLHISMAYGERVARNLIPSIYERARELDVKRRAIDAPPSWRVSLFRQEPQHRRYPKEWMAQPLWSMSV